MRFTVQQIVERIRADLEDQFRDISIEGEISNLTSSSSGHWYFTLSDSEASIKCAIFKMDAMRLPMLRQLKNGDKVEAFGKIGVYVKRGEFQLIARKIVSAGEGDLQKKLEELKARLAKEGLFDQASKQPIPKLPRRIGVITAEKAAALQDFLNIYERRSLWMDILISPALVQGDAAPLSLVKALHRLIAYDQQAEEGKKLDLIVITRGGGSVEDLWAFNDEGLAYEIFNCPIPIISAVGHEVDFSICDYVADLRCETPSAAAEVLTEGMVQLKERMKRSRKSLHTYGQLTVLSMKERLLRATPRRILSLIMDKVHRSMNRLERMRGTILAPSFFRFSEHYQNLDYLVERMASSISSGLERKSLELEQLQALLSALGPNKILQRGYAIITSASGKVIDQTSSFDQLPDGESMSIRFKDGQRSIRKEKQ